MMKEELIEICKLLDKHGVDFLLIGGIAVIYHGYTRSTADIDFWYNPTLSNFHKILKAFKEYGIDVTELEDAIFNPKKTFLRFPVSNLKVEFSPDIPGGITFPEAKANAEILKLDSIKVSVIGFEDLIKNKTATNRTKDKADIEELIKRKRKG